MRLPFRRRRPDWSDLTSWDETDLVLVRLQLDQRRDAIRADLVAIVAELDRRAPTVRPRRSSSVRVVLDPAVAESVADPDG